MWHRNHYKWKKYWTPITSSQGQLLISCEKRSQRNSHRSTSYLRTSQGSQAFPEVQGSLQSHPRRKEQMFTWGPWKLCPPKPQLSFPFWGTVLFFLAQGAASQPFLLLGFFWCRAIIVSNSNGRIAIASRRIVIENTIPYHWLSPSFPLPAWGLLWGSLPGSLTWLVPHITPTQITQRGFRALLTLLAPTVRPLLFQLFNKVEKWYAAVSNFYHRDPCKEPCLTIPWHFTDFWSQL